MHRLILCNKDRNVLIMSYEVEIIDETISDPDIMINMYTFQHEPYIRDAINSVLNQKTKYNWKLLIMDDGSTDGTQEVLRQFQNRYPDKIILAISHKNTHLNFQADILYRFKNVEFLNEIDGDDYWLDPYKIEKHVSFLKNHSEYVGVTGNIINVDRDGNRQHCDFELYPFYDTHIFGKSNVLHMEMVSHSSALTYRNFYRQWDRETFTRVYFCTANGDLVWSSVLGMLGDIYYSHEVYTAHRRVFEGTSWTAQTHGKNNAEMLLEMWEGLYQLIYEVFGEKLQIDNFRKDMQNMIGKEVTVSKRVNEMTKQRNIVRMYDMWMLCKQEGRSVEDILLKDDIKSIVIYGLSVLGVRLFKELEGSRVSVECGIDMNPVVNIPKLKCLHKIPDQKIDTDAIVVTALTTYDDIKANLVERGYSRIIALDELLYRMVPEDKYLKT